MKKMISVVSLMALFSVSAVAALNCTSASPKSLNYLQGTPCGTQCANVVAACNGGGYYLGCEKVNQKGLLAACFNPMVFRGAAVANVSSPGDVSACTACCKTNRGVCR